MNHNTIKGSSNYTQQYGGQEGIKDVEVKMLREAC